MISTAITFFDSQKQKLENETEVYIKTFSVSIESYVKTEGHMQHEKDGWGMFAALPQILTWGL